MVVSLYGAHRRNYQSDWAAICLSGRPLERLNAVPNIKPEDILPEENWKLRIENAKSRILAPCGCRISWGHKCDLPLMTCFACFDRPRGEYYLNQPGRLLKEVSLEESLAIAQASGGSRTGALGRLLLLRLLL